MRSSIIALALVGTFAVAVTAGPPVFSQSYTSDQLSSIVINQGGVAQPDGSVCCPPESPECKVQTAFQAGIALQSVAQNKSAFKNPDGSGVVTDFTLQKEFSVTADGACQEWCPLQGQTIGGQMINPNSTDMGSVKYNGRMLTEWQFVTRIPILNITMEIDNFYVTEGSTPAPVALISLITPLGQHIGTQNTTFVTFTPGNPDPKHFLVTGIASCKMAKCGNGGDDDGGNGSGEEVRRLAANGEVAAPVIRRRLGNGPLEVVYEL